MCIQWIGFSALVKQWLPAIPIPYGCYMGISADSCALNHLKQTSMLFSITISNSVSRQCIWKCCQQNVVILMRPPVTWSCWWDIIFQHCNWFTWPLRCMMACQTFGAESFWGSITMHSEFMPFLGIDAECCTPWPAIMFNEIALFLLADKPEEREQFQ